MEIRARTRPRPEIVVRQRTRESHGRVTDIAECPPIRVRTRPTESWAIARSRNGVVWEDYEVSTFGNVRRRNAFRHWPAGMPLKQFEKSTGYLAVQLYRDRVAKMHSVHDLVCSTFRGIPPETSLVVRHLNGIKTDNRRSNLDWGTSKDNAADAIAHGHIVREAQHGRPQAKHTLAQTAEIKGLFAVGARNVEIVEHYRLSPQAVCNIRKGRTGSFVVPVSTDRASALLRSMRRERGRRQIQTEPNLK